MSCLLTNGGTFGWLNSPSSAILRAFSPVVPAGKLMLRKVVAPVSCRAALMIMGKRSRSGVVLSVLA